MSECHQGSNWYDAELMSDLDKIAAEVKRRKKARPLEPYAFWSYSETVAALFRHDMRVKERSPDKL